MMDAPPATYEGTSVGDAWLDYDEAERRRRQVGQCNFLLLMMLSLTAVICGTNATWWCNFANRKITFNQGYSMHDLCQRSNLTFDQWDQQLCESFFTNNGVGFYAWYTTVPVDQTVCVSYTLFVPGRGYVNPNFDTKFNSAKVFAVMANIFGAFGMFTILFASCCPVTQDKLMGLSCYFFLATLWQGLSFLIMDSKVCHVGWFAEYYPNVDFSEPISDVNCELGDAGSMAIAAACLYFVCSCLAPAAVAPPPIGYSRANTQETN